MLWLKAFHLIFVVTWFAGLFYLPRLFVYHAAAADALGRERFGLMEKRLFTLMSIGATLAFAFGLAMVWLQPGYLDLGWMRAKLVLVALLAGYHVWCLALIRELAVNAQTRSQTWYRWFNEVPILFLFAIVILAIVQPAMP